MLVGEHKQRDVHKLRSVQQLLQHLTRFVEACRMCRVDNVQKPMRLVVVSAGARGAGLSSDAFVPACVGLW